MQRENTETKKKRATRFTVTGEYSNVHLYGKDDLTIGHGDVCVVKPGAPYNDGDLVLIECSDCGTNPPLHYHAKLFNKLHGHKYSFCLSRYSRDGKRYKDGDEKIIVGPVLKVIQKNKAKPKVAGKAHLTSHRAMFDWSYFGVHKDDVLIVAHNGQSPLGKLILFKDGDDNFLQRVCMVKGNTVRITCDNEEPHDIPLSRVIGPVVEIKHGKCVPAQIEALRRQIAILENDSEAWANITKIYEIEKTIFNLEHLPEVEEEFEWPEVIGDE
jgi:hypothetical protein